MRPVNVEKDNLFDLHELVHLIDRERVHLLFQRIGLGRFDSVLDVEPAFDLIANFGIAGLLLSGQRI